MPCHTPIPISTYSPYFSNLIFKKHNMSKAMATLSLPPIALPGKTRGKRTSQVAFALKGDGSGNGYDQRKGRYNGKLVDDNMIVLRMRIREMEMEEKELPENWMEWERRYCGSGDYGSDVYEGVGILQRWLMETRPSLALAMAALVTLSVPMSLGVVVWHLVHILQGVPPMN